MTLADKYRLDSIEVDGFRGHLEPFEFPIKGRVTLLLGPQGSGKTSTLAAVEWCLFGQLAYFKSAESKTDVELVNANKVDESCRVSLRLRRGTDLLEIERTKQARERDTTLSLKVSQDEWGGEEAELRLFNLLGLTFDDFYRSVYLHQESIRGLITDEPSKRDEAIDRLLGLERARNLLNAIPLRDVKKDMDELTRKKESLETEIAGATRQAQSELERAQREAAEQGLEGDEISAEHAFELSRQLQRHVDELAKENGLDAVEFPTQRELATLPRIVSRAKSFFRDCRNKVIEITNVDALREKRSPLQDMMERLDRAAATKTDLKKREKELEKNVGRRDGLDEKVVRERARIQELESQRSKLDATSRLAEDALVLFEGDAPDKCPVCGQRIQTGSVQRHLRELLEAGKKKQLDAITAGIKTAKAHIEEFEEAARKFSDLEEEKEVLESDLATIVEDVAGLLGKKVQATRIRAELRADLDRVGKELEKAQRAYKRREDAIGKAETTADAIKLVHLVLSKKEDFRALKERFSEEDKEITALSEKVTELDAFRSQLQRVVEAINSTQVELAEESVDKGSDEMERLYSELEAHPYYSNFKIDVATKNVAGIQKNTYQIRAFSPRDGKKASVSSRFSTGQMNCAALSIFFALSRLSSHNLGFLILDDPSQNLDSNHKAALTRVLHRLASEKQILVATQDEELQSQLKTSFKSGKNTCLVEFGSWDRKGPKISIMA